MRFHLCAVSQIETFLLFADNKSLYTRIFTIASLSYSHDILTGSRVMYLVETTAYSNNEGIC